jgi:hypothetical protein
MHLILRPRLAAILAVMLLAAPAFAAQSGPVHPRIVNGELTGLLPTTGALLRGTSPTTADAWCSGTLIGCETFLTASHCVDGFLATSFYVFLQHGGIFTVASIDAHPDYEFPIADVAVLKLGTPVDGIAPTPINTTESPAHGTEGLIAGFGRSGDPNYDYGLKREGLVETAACTGAPNGGDDTSLVCWNYTAPIGPPGSDSNTCNADSGGPLFVDFGDGPVVAGITSGGVNFSCLANDHSYDANVYTYRSFIEGIGGADLANTTCGTLPQVGDAGTNVVAVNGTLGSSNPDDTFTVDVIPDTRTLRVALNAIDDGLSDFDLHIKAGSPPTLADYDCRSVGPNQYGFCEIDNPTPGPWYVMVNRFSGNGTYQLTATTFGIDCSLPENDGEPCDDDNTCTTDDACTAGVCAGTPEPDSTPCDDGDGCTQPDVCSAGTCVGQEPTGCALPLESGKAFFRLDDKSPSSRDKLLWRWRKGNTTKASFGNPRTTTDYDLCVYDEMGGVPEKRLHETIPAGDKWSENKRGFRYNDRDLEASAIKSMTLKEGTSGRATIVVNGRGTGLEMPSLPLEQDTTVIVRLLNGTACWEASYGSNQANDTLRFKAKAD